MSRYEARKDESFWTVIDTAADVILRCTGGLKTAAEAQARSVAGLLNAAHAAGWQGGADVTRRADMVACATIEQEGDDASAYGAFRARNAIAALPLPEPPKEGA